MNSGTDISNTSQLGLDAAEVRGSYRESFEALNGRVAGTKFDRFLRFLNFGYAPLEGEEPPSTSLPRNLPNRDSALLLLHVVSDAPTDGLVVEVGCGRGGNIGVLLDRLGARRAVGLDLSYSNVAFCRRSRSSEVASFVQADAERLPVADGAASLVVNIESSGCYPEVERFFREIARITVVGSWFCWADLARREMIDAYRRLLGVLGFEIVTDRDITDNVLASRSQRAERQRLALADGQAADGLDDWVGAEGSELHDQLIDRRCSYQILRARRVSTGSAGTEPLLSPAERAMAAEFAGFGARVLGVDRS